MLLALTLASSPVTASDALVRLGLLYNFSKYTEWPASSFSQANSPLLICLAKGDDEMASGLGSLEQRSVQGHLVKVRLVARPSQVSGCHVLYLPSELSGRPSDYTDAARNSAVLSVSDAEDFVDTGGMIGLLLQNSRYEFEASYVTVKQAGLRLSSHLLKLARRVK